MPGQTELQEQILEEEAKAKENARDWNNITVKRNVKINLGASAGTAQIGIETPLPSTSNHTAEQLAGFVLRHHQDRLEQLEAAENLVRIALCPPACCLARSAY